MYVYLLTSNMTYEYMLYLLRVANSQKITCIDIFLIKSIILNFVLQEQYQ